MPYRILITGLVNGDRKIQTIKGIREADHILCAFENREKMGLREAKNIADKAEELGRSALLFDGLSEHRGKLLSYALELNEVPHRLVEERPEYVVSLTADEIRCLYFRGTAAGSDYDAKSLDADAKLHDALDRAGLPMMEVPDLVLQDDVWATENPDDIPF